MLQQLADPSDVRGSSPKPKPFPPPGNTPYKTPAATSLRPPECRLQNHS